MANETRTPRTPGPMGGLRGKGSKKKTGKQNPSQNPSQSFKKKEPEVLIMQMVDGRQHPDSIKLKKMKKIENDKGNIDFVDLKAKGGRAGYKYGGAAIRGVSKILR